MIAWFPASGLLLVWLRFLYSTLHFSSLVLDVIPAGRDTYGCNDGLLSCAIQILPCLSRCISERVSFIVMVGRKGGGEGWDTAWLLSLPECHGFSAMHAPSSQLYPSYRLCRAVQTWGKRDDASSALPFPSDVGMAYDKDRKGMILAETFHIMRDWSLPSLFGFCGLHR